MEDLIENLHPQESPPKINPNLEGEPYSLIQADKTYDLEFVVFNDALIIKESSCLKIYNHIFIAKLTLNQIRSLSRYTKICERLDEFKEYIIQKIKEKNLKIIEEFDSILLEIEFPIFTKAEKIQIKLHKQVITKDNEVEMLKHKIKK